MSAFVPLTGAAPLAARAPRVHSSASRATAVAPAASVAARAPAAFAAPERQAIGGSAGGGPQAPGARAGRVLVILDGALRVADNAALVGAARAARVPGGALVPFARVDGVPAGAVAELAAELSQRGSALVGVRGDVVAAAMDACRRLRLSAVYVNRCASRDVARMQRCLRAAAQNAGVEVVTFGACGLAVDASRVPDALPLFRRELDPNTVPAPIEAPERLPALSAEARKLGVRDIVARVGAGTAAAVKVLNCIVKEKELRKTKVRTETIVSLGSLLECGSVSEVMVASYIVRKVGTLKGATYEELLWRSYVCARYEKMEKVGASATATAA